MQTTFTSRGYTIDLDRLYRAMFAQSTVVEGERLFRGNDKDVRAVKRLLHELFDVPVQERSHPVNHAIRSECRDRLAELGWAEKHRGRSATYTLYREV